MPLSRLRKKRKIKKGPTPPKNEGMNVKEMHRILDILDKAEQDYYAQQTNDEENKDG